MPDAQQPVAAEHPEGFAERRAADGEGFRQRHLVREPRARLQPAGGDLGAQGVGDPPRQRLARRRLPNADGEIGDQAFFHVRELDEMGRSKTLHCCRFESRMSDD